MNDTPSDDEAAQAKEAVRKAQLGYLKGLTRWEDVFKLVNRALEGQGGEYLDKLGKVYDPNDGGGRHDR